MSTATIEEGTPPQWQIEQARAEIDGRKLHEYEIRSAVSNFESQFEQVLLDTPEFTRATAEAVLKGSQDREIDFVRGGDNWTVTPKTDRGFFKVKWRSLERKAPKGTTVGQQISLVDADMDPEVKPRIETGVTEAVRLWGTQGEQYSENNSYLYGTEKTLGIGRNILDKLRGGQSTVQTEAQSPNEPGPQTPTSPVISDIPTQDI